MKHYAPNGCCAFLAPRAKSNVYGFHTGTRSFLPPLSDGWRPLPPSFWGFLRNVASAFKDRRLWPLCGHPAAPLTLLLTPVGVGVGALCGLLWGQWGQSLVFSWRPPPATAPRGGAAWGGGGGCTGWGSRGNVGKTPCLLRAPPPPRPPRPGLAGL